MFKNTSAEATGRLVVEAADALGVALTPEIAAPAYAALATDTGWFRFASTSADTYRLAGRLVDAGAKPDLLYKQLYEGDTLGRVRLIGARSPVRKPSWTGGSFTPGSSGPISMPPGPFRPTPRTSST